MYIQCIWQGNHHTYGHIRCVYTIVANPSQAGLGVNTASDSKAYNTQDQGRTGSQNRVEQIQGQTQRLIKHRIRAGLGAKTGWSKYRARLTL